METPNPVTPRTSKLAWASLILGILGVFGSIVCVGVLLAIPAVICGHLALQRIKASAGAERGRGLALTGLATGYVGIVVALTLAIVRPMIGGGHPPNCRITCSGNLKQIGLALRIYSADYDGQFPEDLSLLVRLKYLTALRVYTCPSTTTEVAASSEAFYAGGHCDYLYFGKGLTEACNGHDLKTTILSCDKPGNHRKFMNVVFADGHVRGYTGTADIADLARREKLYLPGK